MHHLFYFNSIKVRLERCAVLFQVAPCAYFNSIKVRLERLMPLSSSIPRNFNSIKVRLERLSVWRCERSLIFQFHKGTIRTMATFIVQYSLLYFNSIKVRLELLIMLLMIPLLSHFNSIKVRLEPFTHFLPMG